MFIAQESSMEPVNQGMFASQSYSSIDLKRRDPNELKECKLISSVIYSKSKVENLQEERKVEEWTPEQKALFAPQSYASIDLSRKPSNQKNECSWISSGIFSRSKAIKEEKEEWTPEQKALFAPQSYASIDLSRKAPKEEDTLVNYLDHPESEDVEEKEEEVEEWTPEQKIMFAPRSYASIDLTKNNPLDSSCYRFPEVTTPKYDKEAPEEPKSESAAEKSENLAPKSPENSDIQPPAKIPRKNKIDTSFVMPPVKKIEGDTPQRPFPKELCWHNPAVSGTATEIFDMVFKQSSQAVPRYTTADFAAPASALKIIEQARQKALQTNKGTPKNQQKPLEQKKVLQSVQNTLWLVHSYKKDQVLEQAMRSTIQKFSATRGDDGRLRIMDKKDLSMVWNLSQREVNWQVKPVVIDGLSILDMVSDTTGLPMLQVQILIEILLHFILDGHLVTLHLPEVYKTSTDEIDDLDIFKFLCTLDVIKFVSKKSRKAVKAEVLAEAEKTAGIICSNSDDLHTLSSFQCFPAIQKISSGNYTVSTVFVDSFEKCRLYSKETAQIDTSIYQLTLERQAFLISSLIHVTTFHGQRQQQIEVFLMIVSRFLPEILPKFMQKSMITAVGESIGMLQAEGNLVNWPIF